MRATEQIGRYRLLDLVRHDAGADGSLDAYLWRAFDEVLDRPVAVRVLSADDPRCPAVLGAAQAAAAVDDRRLLRVLDILNLPITATDPARIAVVSEWASGRNLERTIQDRQGRPFGSTEALALVAEVARATATAAVANVSHGRLRPSSVFITDAGEVRVRGLAVDAAVFGEWVDSAESNLTSRAQADVDALGSLLYLLATGYWPGVVEVSATPAPRANGVVLPPSQVRAGVPRSIDDIVARSVTAATRPREVARVTDSTAFATVVSATLDHLAPVAGAVTEGPVRRTARMVGVNGLRTIAVASAALLVLGIAWVGWQLATSGPAATVDKAAQSIDILTSSARPLNDEAVTGIEQTYPVVRYRTYDPFGDDNADGRPDKNGGRENQDTARTVNDVDPETAWLTAEYSTANLDGKEGVGLILDLGQPRDVQGVRLRLVGKGSSVDIRVSDHILPDPALWTPLAAVNGAKAHMVVRAPRPVTGRYVLIWFTRLPPSTDNPANYQGGVRKVVVSG